MNTPYRILRLRSGEDIITRIKGKRGNKYIIERPMQMKVSSIIDPENNKVVRKDFLLLRDWLQYTNHNETEIPEDWVAIILTPDEQASVSYDRAKEDEDVEPRTESITIPNTEPTEPMNPPIRNNIDPNCIMVTLAIPPMIFVSLLSQGLLNAGQFGIEEDFENENENEEEGPGNYPTDGSPTDIEDYFDDED
jgi:hypothetical protein